VAPSFEQVRQLAQQLPEDQRIQLANSLWESVEIEESDKTATEIEAAWGEEAERRVAEIEAGTAVTFSWEEVEEPLRVRLAR
jgi:putative addiction module component (TIGR02574 family)